MAVRAELNMKKILLAQTFAALLLWVLPALSHEGRGPFIQTAESRAAAAEGVVSIQKHLLMMGYEVGRADGIAGSRTQAAIRAYQAAYGLEVDGESTPALEQHITRTRKAQVMGSRDISGVKTDRKRFSSGTGLIVSKAGFALTNYHVVKDCNSITTVNRQAERSSASLDSFDEISDLAVLRLASASATVAALAPAGSIHRGAQVTVVGYPLQDALAPRSRITTGVVRATAGIRDDTTWFQITAPLQPGDSGGPVLDEWSRVIGLVVASLSAESFKEIFGDIPGNVNFAIKSDLLRIFLRANEVPFETGLAQHRSSSPATVGIEAAEFTVFVECWR